MDLGECTKIHDLALRADYEIASKERDLFFELDAMDHLESFIAECDRRTELAKKRLAETQEEISAEVSAKAEKVHELNEDIGKLLAKAEQLGAEGNVDESQKILMEVEKVRAKKKEAEEEYRNSMPASSFQQQKLRVCEVCSAYLGLHDNDRRLADHFGGKLHLGFIQIREKLDQLRKTVAEKQEKRNQDRLRRREEREREERMGRRYRGFSWVSQCGSFGTPLFSSSSLKETGTTTRALPWCCATSDVPSRARKSQCWPALAGQGQAVPCAPECEPRNMPVPFSISVSYPLIVLMSKIYLLRT
ncbi:putative RNA-binding protein Luc7-like 1 isoform X4 [Apteryx rowi]|uniref:putative RNA-binding protein Luc7-like 1 isoform X4 n=1 Tax=Apteryx rowi TaxID=308060 RepID=UPI000E1CD318|nr:putative RNA-binding protein Luc7-like 1 isoform X4 [Apteryx rowi]